MHARPIIATGQYRVDALQQQISQRLYIPNTLSSLCYHLSSLFVYFGSRAISISVAIMDKFQAFGKNFSYVPFLLLGCWLPATLGRINA